MESRRTTPPRDTDGDGFADTAESVQADATEPQEEPGLPAIKVPLGETELLTFYVGDILVEVSVKLSYFLPEAGPHATDLGIDLNPDAPDPGQPDEPDGPPVTEGPYIPPPPTA